MDNQAKGLTAIQNCLDKSKMIYVKQLISRSGKACNILLNDMEVYKFTLSKICLYVVVVLNIKLCQYWKSLICTESLWRTTGGVQTGL